MIRKRETEQQLRERIEDALVRDVGVSPTMAQPFIDSVMRCFAGEQAYFPAAPRDYPVLHIRAALERGVPVKQVMQEFDVSRSKLHELFPGGLPRKVLKTA
ncbi:hypothetical protein PQS31_06180 [Luteimonas sp BLCC-B24]|uniref:hypothetical protein n=1 Tax=Luteimonas sp. BLCC-B24 TaxID=3025317 RepID=UPI00234C8D02|nr:hypothetical protein [Luteimonas sp. BLCC-B24]MDC7806411.1 hypothetical protein [Luteimonas sp. BLCC-B24]